MKNLAICFSGAIRSFHLCHESIKKMIIDPLREEYNVYVFGHFWTLKQEENLEDLAYRMKWKKESECVYDLIKNFGFTEYIIEEYNSKREQEIMDNLGLLGYPYEGSSKSLKVVSANNSNVPTLAQKILGNYKLIEDQEKRSQYLNYAVNCMGMYYKILMSNNLKNEWAKNNNIQFDYAIRMRPDFLWNDKIPAGIFEKVTDKNIVLVYDNYCTRAKWQGNDKFFGGTNTMMNSYCDLYNQFEYFFNKGIRIEGQELAQGMVRKMALDIVFFGTENTYDKVAGPLYRRLEKVWARKEESA